MDALIRVRLLSGDERILHAEVQAQKRDGFEHRGLTHRRVGVEERRVLLRGEHDVGVGQEVEATAHAHPVHRDDAWQPDVVEQRRVDVQFALLRRTHRDVGQPGERGGDLGGVLLHQPHVLGVDLHHQGGAAERQVDGLLHAGHGLDYLAVVIQRITQVELGGRVGWGGGDGCWRPPCAPSSSAGLT